MNAYMKACEWDDVEESGCVLVKSPGKFTLWVDVWRDGEGEYHADWNKYVFDMRDPKDLEIMLFQDDPQNAEEFFAVALEFADNLKKGAER